MNNLLLKQTIKMLSNTGSKTLRNLSTEAQPELNFTTLKVTNPHQNVFHVELNRPAKRNAMNVAFFEYKI